MAEFRDIINDIKHDRFAPVYILMGEEPYYIDRIVEALEAKVVAEEDKEFDQTIIYGADTEPGKVMEETGRFPMMSERRLVVLKEAQAMRLAKSQLNKLSPYVANPSKLTVFALAFKGDKLSATSELLKAAKKNKEVVVFDSPKVKDYRLGEVVRDYCFTNKIDIDAGAIEMLVANVGSSLGNMFSEIEKLRVVLKGEKKKITADMVQDHIGVSKEFNNFELNKALARRDYYQSINIVKHFEANPKENPTVVTTATLFNYFQQLLLAAFSTDKTDKGLMDALKLKNSYALKDIRTGLAHYNATQLVKAIHAIRAFDAKSKGIGSFQKEYTLLLELVITIITL